MFGAPRGTEILIAITIYNEDDVLLGRTLQGVLRSIKYIPDLESHPAWHKES